MVDPVPLGGAGGRGGWRRAVLARAKAETGEAASSLMEGAARIVSDTQAEPVGTMVETV